MKNILLFGAGKSATCLIDYLIADAPKYKWRLTVVDNDLSLAQSKTGNSIYANPVCFDIRKDVPRKTAIEEADLVISMLPAVWHEAVAKDCLTCRKHLLTASYTDNKVRELAPEIEKAGILFMYEMGLDPGIDHMSAMRLIHSIKNKGGLIHSFRSFCGGLIDPTVNDNPWHYKISWSPRNVVLAGKSGALYKEKGKTREISYEELFEQGKTVQIAGLGKLSYYPNRDSLDYMKLYHLEEADTFLRATLRFPDFCEGWNALVKLGLTDEKVMVNTDQLPYSQWAAQNLASKNNASKEEKMTSFLHVRENSKVIRQLKYLGLLNGGLINLGKKSNADILQSVLENKLRMGPGDRDMVILQHEIEFERRAIRTRLISSMVYKGENSLRTGMAKTVGLPLGILAKLILTGKISLTGLHIPVLPAVYLPILKELEAHQIRFEEYFE